jgi:hypothetical protein
VEKVPKYRLNQIAAQFAFGVFFGFVLLMLALSGVLAVGWLFPSIQDWTPTPPLSWILVIVSIATLGLPIWTAIAFVISECRDQIAEHRLATNLCMNCGYPFGNLRRIRDKCPECGTTFKRLQ